MHALLLEEGVELLASGEGVNPATLLELCLSPGAVVQSCEGVHPHLLVALCDSWGCHHAAPIGEVEVNAALSQGRHVWE
jgi:hypothetical protein